MQETCVSIGNEAPWVVAAAQMAVVAGIAIGRSVRIGKPSITIVEGAFLAWNAVVWLLSIPDSIWWPVLIAISLVGVLTMAKGPRTLSPRAKVVIGVLAVVAPVGFFLFMFNSFEHRIVLGDSQVQQTIFGKVRQAPRIGLRVYTTGSTRSSWLDNRPWSSWSSIAGDEFGPSLAGFEVFIGPHGVIRGDDLGRRLAQWADTTPVYVPSTPREPAPSPR